MQMTLEDVAFASGQSQLRAEASDSISKLVEFVQADPEKRIRIEGHTDFHGDDAYNLKLSDERAAAVREPEGPQSGDRNRSSPHDRGGHWRRPAHRQQRYRGWPRTQSTRRDNS